MQLSVEAGAGHTDGRLGAFQDGGHAKGRDVHACHPADVPLRTGEVPWGVELFVVGRPKVGTFFCGTFHGSAIYTSLKIKQ